MNAFLNVHAVSLRPPFFGTGNAGTQLHRYLEPDFTQKFQRQLQRRELDRAEHTAWRDEDRFSDHDDKLVLRLPLHKTFYVVSCEVVCERLGLPALDPAKITSAGFVIRRQNSSGEQSWMLEEDEALGWEDTPTGLRDPDVHRRLCRDGTLHPRENVATYTGEQTHPLQPLSTKDANGKTRTVLFGYLPLGGSYTFRQSTAAATFDADSLEDFSQAAAEHLPWPYGVRQPLNKTWQSRYARPVEQGVPGKEFFELLRLVVNRYHLGETGIDDNDQLQQLAENIYFYDEDAAGPGLNPAYFNDYSRSSYDAWRKYSLWSWLNYHAGRDTNRLAQWLAQQETLVEAAGGLGATIFMPLPGKSAGGNLAYSLYLTAGDAQEFRSLLDQRVLDQALSNVREIPVPKFQQRAEDTYQIVPFVRAKDDQGKERIYWAGDNTRSELVRVAAPFDPNASRPSLIQMPSLGDLKKGLAKGVSMITPPDTFNLVNALNLKKGASEDVLPAEEGSGIGIQWICSFSLPVITLVAMIILMIMISLLNIIFFWLPWVKICLPFPKMK